MEVIMILRTWTIVLSCFLAAPATAMPDRGDDPRANERLRDEEPRGGVPVHPTSYQRTRGAEGFSVRWIGQDGRDYVSPNNRMEPSEVQDIHLSLLGLDPRHEVAFIDVLPQGGDQWQYNNASFAWKAELKRQKGSRMADLYIEPSRVETGRIFHVSLRYDDGSTVETDLRSRKTDPNLRMPSAALQARWIGQDRHDAVGTGPSVGPDGLQDAKIRLAGLGVKVPIRSIRIDGSGGTHWEFGTNPQLLPNAELIRNAKDASQGDLVFQPERNPNGQRLKITVLYENEKRDVATITATRIDPALRMVQTPSPKIEEKPLAVEWLGQDGEGSTRLGDIHVVLGGLSTSARLVAVVLNDSVTGVWSRRLSDQVPIALDEFDRPMDVVVRADRKSADLFFPPVCDAKGDTFTVRLVDADGRMSYARFPGGPCDLARCAPAPELTRVEAHPGDDLQVLVDRYGTVVLSKGTYRLSHGLVLNRPINLISTDGATLLFTQDQSDRPWTTAIKVRCSNTTLDGFAVRFEGAIRWNNEVSYGPAVIGMTDNLDPGYDDSKVSVVFRRLDLDTPAAENPGGWVDAVRLMRLCHLRSGVIAENTLRGGPIEFFEGPWQIVDNQYKGTPPGTFSQGVLTGHSVHDVLVRGNRLSSPRTGGKTWRFLVLTGHGARDRVENNTIEGIGARDDDTISWMNAPEIILTEGYSLKYEGRVSDLAPDGKLIRIGDVQWDKVRTGDVISILSGPAAGQWRRVAQAINPTTFLVDEPIPLGTDVVSISSGFVNEVFEGNRIDLRGGKRSDSFVLAGNHFGTRVINNHLLGGSLAYRLMACPTEHPMIWGWSHAPYLGGVVEGNILEDCEQGGVVGVEHGQSVKTNKGRTYMSVQLRKNVVRWSEPFLARMSRADSKEPLAGLTIGYRPSVDPGELIVSAEGNTLDAPPAYRNAPALLVHAALYNSQKMVNRKFRLPADSMPDAGHRTSSTRGSGSRH
jgi:hypothetical protein